MISAILFTLLFMWVAVREYRFLLKRGDPIYRAVGYAMVEGISAVIMAVILSLCVSVVIALVRSIL